MSVFVQMIQSRRIPTLIFSFSSSQHIKQLEIANAHLREGLASSLALQDVEIRLSQLETQTDGVRNGVGVSVNAIII